MYNDDNIFYSNQGEKGSSIRHAVAKAIVSQILYRSGYRINLSLRSTVNFLLNFKY